jgi:hypothetical protein
MWDAIFDFTHEHGLLWGLFIPMAIVACIITYLIKDRIKQTHVKRLSGKQQIFFGFLIFGGAFTQLAVESPETLKKVATIFTEEKKHRPKRQVYFSLTERKGYITDCKRIAKKKAEVTINGKSFILPHRFCGNLRPIMEEMIIYHSDKNNVIWQIDRLDKTPFMTLQESGYET